MFIFYHLGIKFLFEKKVFGFLSIVFPVILRHRADFVGDLKVSYPIVNAVVWCKIW
jgi:hypothetical protein